MKFKNKDRVKVVSENSARNGELGTVLQHDSDGNEYNNVVVEFDSDGRRVSYRDEDSLRHATFMERLNAWLRG